MAFDVDVLRREARALLQANTRRGVRHGRRYTYTVPSIESYPFQWFWDSCFHAIAWAQFDAERAAEEVRALLAWQRPDGFIPHVIFWNRRRGMRKAWHWLESRAWMGLPWVPVAWGKPETTEMIQPPVLAQAVERVFDAGAGEAFLREAVPALLRYHRWLIARRDPDGDGLISIVAPSESGMDFSPVYDAALGLSRDPPGWQLVAAMRMVTLRNKARGWDIGRILSGSGFAVEDMLVNACMIRGLGALARLAACAGDEEGASWARGQAERSLGSLLDRSWDAEAAIFRNLDGPAERPAPALTVGGLMPLVIPELPRDIAERIVERHLLPGRGFAPRYPVASVALTEPAFRADSRTSGIACIWRGGTWINANWMLAHGLREHGFPDIAEEVRRASLALVGRYSYREYFNPLEGTPGGAHNFGWSTLAVDI